MNTKRLIFAVALAFVSMAGMAQNFRANMDQSVKPGDDFWQYAVGNWLKNTSIQITCLDEDGNVLKRVTSGDSGDIEDNENGSGTGTEDNGGNTGGGGDGGDDLDKN